MNTKLTYLFLVLALITGFQALKSSGALSGTLIERQVRATIIEPEELAIIDLLPSSEDNPLKVNKNYSTFGEVVSNFLVPVTVTVTVEPDFSKMMMNRMNPRFEFSIRAGTGVVSYGVMALNFPTPKTLTFSLTPGSRETLEVALDSQGEEPMAVSLSFHFSSDDGSVDLTLEDTDGSPMKIHLE
ncbi:MAG: hypothetical protein AVO33_11170 [delta proteobacterium ML8_F1]|nr:MAG: hypothetical protein AVO33_11170 [delta proteobacterium ML8_F1]